MLKLVFYGLCIMLGIFLSYFLNHFLIISTLAFAVLLILNLVWVAGDLYPILETKIARSRCGSITDDIEYLNSIGKIALNWLSTTPPLEIIDRRPAFSDYLLRLRSGAFHASNPLKYSWPHAVLAKGVLCLADATGRTDDYAVLQNYLNRFIAARTTDCGSLLIRKLDEGMNGEVALALYNLTGAPLYLNAADAIAKYYLERAVQEHGILAYEAPDPSGIRFVDALPLMCPFLARYGEIADTREATELSIRQLNDFITHGIEKETGLPFHAYDPINENAPVGLIGWGRGCGWYGMGLIDTLGALRKDSPYRNDLAPAVHSLAYSVISLQRDDGGWGSLLTRSNSPYDSSASALLTYFLQRASEEQLLSDINVEAAIERAIYSLKMHTRKDGRVDFAQGNCMGFDRMSQKYAPTAYSQGMALAVMVKHVYKRKL